MECEMEVRVSFRLRWEIAVILIQTRVDENNPQCAFWHEWLGADSPGKARLNIAAREDPKTTSHRVLTVTHDAIWHTLRTLEDSKGSILLREGYTSLYDRLLSPFGDYYCSGVLVKGQPGIGEHVSRTRICTKHQS